MKTVKLQLAFCVMLLLTFSCTQNQRARNFGGSETINLPKGQRLITATWKQNNLWYLTEPMPAGYIPSKKEFQESSSYSVWEGKVVFIESN